MLLVTRAGFPTRVAVVAGSWSLACPMPAAVAEPLVAALRVCPTGPQAEEIVPMPVLMSHLIQKMWDPVVVSRRYRFAYPTLVHPAAGIADRVVLAPRDLVLLVTRAGFPTRVAVVAGSWSLACPMLVAVAQAAVSPVLPKPLPAAAHSGPRRRAAVSLAYPMHQLVALAAPRDYRSPAPVDSSHLAQPVVLGVANQ